MKDAIKMVSTGKGIDMVAIARLTESPPVEPSLRGLRGQLARIEPISLEAVTTAAGLQDRIDTKFVFSAAELPALLDTLASDYRILEINGARLHRYQTLYFDTPGFDLYQAQHAGRPDRLKVRSRRYVETLQAYFEVKHKNRKARTIKHRYLTDSMLIELDDTATGFVDEMAPFPAKDLEPKLWNRFSRVTLVGRNSAERITIDIDIAFAIEQAPVVLGGVVVAEVKQESIDRATPFMRQMRLRNIHETSFSKYCIGAALLYEELKHNRFKPVLLQAARISERYHQP